MKDTRILKHTRMIYKKKQGPAGQRWVIGRIKQIKHFRRMKHFNQIKIWPAMAPWAMDP